LANTLKKSSDQGYVFLFSSGVQVHVTLFTQIANIHVNCAEKAFWGGQSCGDLIGLSGRMQNKKRKKNLAFERTKTTPEGKISPEKKSPKMWGKDETGTYICKRE